MEGVTPGPGVPQNVPTADVATPGAHGTPQQQPAHHPMFAAGALHLHDQMLACALQAPDGLQGQLLSQLGQAMENDLGTGATTHLTQLFQ